MFRTKPPNLCGDRFPSNRNSLRITCATVYVLWFINRPRHLHGRWRGHTVKTGWPVDNVHEHALPGSWYLRHMNITLSLSVQTQGLSIRVKRRAVVMFAVSPYPNLGHPEAPAADARKMKKPVCDSQCVALLDVRSHPCRYMAPEVYRREPFDGRQADIWAMGVTFFLCVFGRYPWLAPITNLVRAM